MINFNALDFNVCRSEEVMFLLMHSVFLWYVWDPGKALLS